MDVKEFANTFGMSVKELSEESDYTKQALYDLFSQKCGVNKNRFHAFLERFTKIAYNQYENDCRNANIAKCKKLKALNDLAKKLDGGGSE